MSEWAALGWLALAIAGVVAVEWHLRRQVLARVRDRMLAASGHAAPAAPDRPADVEAAAAPHLQRWTVGHTPLTAYEVEHAWNERALAWLGRGLRTDLRFAAVHAAVPVLVMLGFGPAGPQAAWLGVLAAALLAGFALARHAIGLHRLGALDDAVSPQPSEPLWKRTLKWMLLGIGALLILVLGIAMIPLGVPAVPAAWALRKLSAEIAETIVSFVLATLSLLFAALPAFAALGLLVSSAGWPARLGGAAMAVAVVLHLARLVGQGRAMRQAPGSALLVLRVFGQQQATEFTFNGLIRAWRYFGHHFTVVDGSLVSASGQHKLGWLSRAGLLLFIGTGMALGGGVAGGGAVLALAAGAGATVLAALVVAAIAGRRIDRRFIRSREQLLARLRRLEQRPRNLDLSYRHERALCHDDTWFMAVGEFAQRADVVLMDLRGLSATNKGCETEIEFLFDAVEADRIVFLVDHQAPAAVDALLARCWRLQDPRSPNVQRSEPVLTLFVAGLVSSEVERQALARTLMLRADARLSARLAAARPADGPRAAAAAPGRITPA